jgi:hypothetical protein
MVNPFVTFAEEKPNLLSYEKGTESMMKNNLELVSLNKQLELQKEILKETKDEAERLRNSVSEDSEKANERAIKVFVDPVKAENALASLQRQLEGKNFDLSMQLKQIYIDYSNISNKITSLQQNLTATKTDYEQKKARLNLGLIKATDLLAYETSIKEVEKNLLQAQNDLEMKLLEFNYLITGKTENVYMPLVDKIESILINPEIDLDKIDSGKLLLDYAANDDVYLTYKAQINEYEQFLHVERSFPSSTAAYNGYKKDIENTNFKILNQHKQLRYQILEDYYDLHIKQLDIMTAKNDLKSAEITLAELKANFKLNKITRLDLQRGEIKLIDAHNSLLEAMGTFDILFHTLARYQTK